VTRTLYLVRDAAFGRKQIEAAFAVALNPAARAAVLAPVPMAGNAKLSEVVQFRLRTAAALLNRSYDDEWQVYVLSTDGRLNDRDVLEPLGVRFASEVSAKDLSKLVEQFGAVVSVGVPAPAGESLPLPGNRKRVGLGVVVKSLLRLLPGLPEGRLKANIEVNVGAGSAAADHAMADPTSNDAR